MGNDVSTFVVNFYAARMDETNQRRISERLICTRFVPRKGELRSRRIRRSGY